MQLRLGTVGMMSAAMVSVLTCYTLSLRVSAERSQVEELRGHIAGQMKDIRALEAELKTRSRLPQLQRWNDEVLALSAPTAKQYAEDAVQLASFAPGAPVKPVDVARPMPAVVREPAPQPAASPLVHTASYTLPSAPVVAPRHVEDDDADAEQSMGKPVPAKPRTSSASVRPELVEGLSFARRQEGQSFDKLKTNGWGGSRLKVTDAKATPKAGPKGLDDLFGEIDKAASAERAKGKLVKVALR